MDFEVFKSFIHPSILEAFDNKVEGGEDYSKTIKNCFDLASRDYSSFVDYLIRYGGYPTFDSQVYILKKGMALLYTWMLQHTSFLKDLNLSGLGISNDQVFKHFQSLLEAEEDDVKEMKDEALTQMKERKEESTSSTGIRLNFKPNRNCYGRYR